MQTQGNRTEFETVQVTNTMGPSAQPMVFRYDPDMTVAALKEQVNASMGGLGANRFRLSTGGRELAREGQTLRESGVPPGATLQTIPARKTGGVFDDALLSSLPDVLQNRLVLEEQRAQMARIPLRPFTPTVWATLVKGAGPWAGQRFRVTIGIPIEYPYSPPDAQFEQLVNPRHPNIDDSGRVCLSILGKDWDPVYSLVNVQQCLEWLMANPNFHSALNLDDLRRWHI